MSTNDNRREWRTLLALWGPGFLVALAAGVATAHGLFEVALAAGTPTPIAWLYPLITDGLAMVAYAATAKLAGSGRAYAWSVVVLAAGLSGLAQAVYLAGSVAAAPPALRFGVGAWPAIAAAIVAHLLFMLGHARAASTVDSEPVQAEASNAVEPQRSTPPVQPPGQPSVQSVVQSPALALDAPTVVLPAVQADDEQVGPPRPRVQPLTAESSSSPAKDRARAAARSHLHRTGHLPTVTELVNTAQVSRGTAGTALQELRDKPADLHLVDDENQLRNSS